MPPVLSWASLANSIVRMPCTWYLETSTSLNPSPLLEMPVSLNPSPLLETPVSLNPFLGTPLSLLWKQNFHSEVDSSPDVRDTLSCWSIACIIVPSCLYEYHYVTSPPTAVWPHNYIHVYRYCCPNTSGLFFDLPFLSLNVTIIYWWLQNRSWTNAEFPCSNIRYLIFEE